MTPFPLLGLELTRQAGRRSTYALRVLFGLVLLAVVVVGYPSPEQWDVGRAARWGLARDGRRMLFRLVEVLLAGIALVQPMVMADAIAGERVRGSLDLLRVCGLRPGSILLQKILARLLPMSTVLALALPLGAAAYGVGGISPHELPALAGLVLLALLQVAALGLFCSTLARTPVAAAALTYALLALVQLGPLRWPTAAIGSPWGVLHDARAGELTAAAWLAAAWPLAACVPVGLLLARLAWRHHERRPRRGRFLRGLDRLLRRLDLPIGPASWGVVGATVPGYDPIRWLHTERGGMGRALQLGLLISGLAAAAYASFPALEAAVSGAPLTAAAPPWVIGVAWLVAALLVGCAAAAGVAGERARGTLEPLLLTPMRGDRILHEMMGGVRRVAELAWGPLLALIATRALVLSLVGPLRAVGGAIYAVACLVLAGRVLALVRWVGLGLGLLLPRTVAVAVTLVLLLVWIGLPLWIGQHQFEDGGVLIFGLSPLASLVIIEAGDTLGWWGASLVLFFVPLHLLVLVGLVWLVRNLVLIYADRLLGRPVSELMR